MTVKYSDVGTVMFYVGLLCLLVGAFVAFGFWPGFFALSATLIFFGWRLI